VRRWPARAPRGRFRPVNRLSWCLTRETRASAGTIAALLVASVVACSAADQAPLGGPHGGVAAQPVTSGAPGATGSSSGAGSGSSSGSGGGGTSSTGADAGTSTAPSGGCTAAAAPATAPTFTAIYTKYFAPGDPVDCSTGSGCHAEFKAETTAWAFLLEYNQVGTSPPGLTDPNSSWLAWYGGNMPESGTSCNPQAMSDLNAWAAAGGQNN
jgi:hypothetical protein